MVSRNSYLELSKTIYTEGRLISTLIICLLCAPFQLQGSMTTKKLQAKSNKSFRNSSVSATTHVLRGRLLSGQLGDINPLQEEDLHGIPPLENLSEESKLQLAIKEFRLAVLNREGLDGYSLAQVYGYLARTLRLLGMEYQRQAERFQENKKDLSLRANKNFQQSVHTYYLALSSDSGDLKYNFAVEAVRSIVISGDLNSALTSINKFEKSQLKPNSYSDYELLKIKAEIYWMMERYEDAGLAYEKWIARGNVNPANFHSGSVIFDKLRILRDTTGHPNNLPTIVILERP